MIDLNGNSVCITIRNAIGGGLTIWVNTEEGCQFRAQNCKVISIDKLTDPEDNFKDAIRIQPKPELFPEFTEKGN